MNICILHKNNQFVSVNFAFFVIVGGGGTKLRLKIVAFNQMKRKAISKNVL